MYAHQAAESRWVAYGYSEDLIGHLIVSEMKMTTDLSSCFRLEDSCDTEDPFVSSLMQSLESPTKAVCETPRSNIEDVYQYLMDKGFDKIASFDPKNICYSRIMSQVNSDR